MLSIIISMLNIIRQLGVNACVCEHESCVGVKAKSEAEGVAMCVREWDDVWVHDILEFAVRCSDFSCMHILGNPSRIST